jgi:hypothetical protein
MTLKLWLAALALVGAGFAGHGGWILATRRAGKRVERAYRSVADAGGYRLCVGTGLLCVSAAAWLHSDRHEVAGIALLVIAVAALGLAVLRYRPRFGVGGGGRDRRN